jgi:hypothetical protein
VTHLFILCFAAVNTPNVGGKLGQQGYHSGNVVSQQGRKRKKEQNAGKMVMLSFILGFVLNLGL